MKMNLKKSTLAVSMLLLTAGNAQALSIDVTTMRTYDGSGDPVFFAGGLNTSIVGTVSSANDGAFNYGTTPFLGVPWFATQVMADETTGLLRNWSGATAMGAFSYDYTLEEGQLATGLYISWSANEGIAVLAIFDCGVGVASTFCSSVHTAGPAPQGTVMQNGPFAGDNITFSFEGVVSAVPIPAALWLFGSGLIGLIGLAGKKTA